MIKRIEVWCDEWDGVYAEESDNGPYIRWDDVQKAAQTTIDRLESINNRSMYLTAEDAISSLMSEIGLQNVVDAWKVTKP